MNIQRIAKNTLMLYVRMLFSMLVSLYTSRVILQALGVEDYGINNVVGGLVSMFSLVSGSLSSSVSRFLTFELGRNDVSRLARVFSTSICIHAVLAVIVLILMETVGVYFLNTRMTIPSARLEAANWVFQASILSFILGLLSVPYNASIVAHEKMGALAYISIVDVVLRLMVTLFVAYAPWRFDRLIVYSVMSVGVSIIFRCINVYYCRFHFEECRLHWSFDRSCWKSMSAFAGWNFIGCTAGLLKDQGVNILLNLFGGPLINAARGIAVTVNSAVNSFSGNFMAALQPQIIKSYVAGDRVSMMSLVERGSRFSFYLLLILALPVLMETGFVLTLWLKQYPAHTEHFVRLVILLSMLEVLSQTLIVLQTATGKIRNYQLGVGGVLMLNFPLSYMCLKAGLPPESVYVAALLVGACCLGLRLFFLKKMVSLSILHYVRNVCLNVLAVSFMALILPLSLCCSMEDGLQRFAILTPVCVVCTISAIYWIGCSRSERSFLTERVQIVWKRCRR